MTRWIKLSLLQLNAELVTKKYKKVITITKKYYAHDEKNDANIGDTVTIAETRPTSKLKRWRLKEIQRRAVV